MLPHRAMSEDRTPVAGAFDQERAAIIFEGRHKTRQGWQGSQGGGVPRSGMALVLSPRPSDPPPPTQITSVRKADGTFKLGHSAQAEMLTTYFNQSFFRFEGGRSTRSLSTPPDFRDSAGSPTGAGPCTTHKFGGPNPLTMEGHLGDTGRSTYRRHNLSNNSANMARLTNHEATEKMLALESTVRLQSDKTFADLCAYTDRMTEETAGKALHFKSSYGHKTSPKIREAFEWNE